MGVSSRLTQSPARRLRDGQRTVRLSAAPNSTPSDPTVTIWPMLATDANEHLREQDRKRDQILAFFAALIGFVLTQYSELKERPLGHVIYLVMFVAGVLVSAITIRYKSWHEKYVIAAIVAYKMVNTVREDPSERDLLLKAYTQTVSEKGLGMKDIFVSSESLILNAFFLLNSINLFFFAFAAGWPSDPWSGSLAPMASVLYIAICNAWIVHSFREVYRTPNPSSIWMLRIFID